MESYGNKLVSPGNHKSRFYVNPCKIQRTVTVSMNALAIPNIDVKFWTKKSEFPQGDLLHSLTQSEITKQRPFEPTDIEYDGIKDEISRI